MGVTESLQALQPASRIIYDSLNCTYQLVPFEGCYTRVAILDTLHQMHAPVVETLVVDDQTAWLVPQQFHHVVRRVYEHEHVTAVQVMPHVAVHYPTQHIEVLSHVRRLRVKPELRSLSKAEHRLQAFQNCIYHSRGQPTLNAHVSAPGRTKFNAHPIFTGGV